MAKNKSTTISHDEARKRLLGDEATAKEYRELAPRYAAVRQLIQLRHERGLTQTDLANLIGVSQSRISMIEAGENDIRLGTLAKLADALGATLEVNLVGTDAEESTAIKFKQETVFQEVAATVLRFVEGSSTSMHWKKNLEPMPTLNAENPSQAEPFGDISWARKSQLSKMNVR